MNPQKLGENLNHAVTLLYTHGFMTEKERNAIRRRLNKKYFVSLKTTEKQP